LKTIEIVKPDKQKLIAYLFKPEMNYEYMLIICHGFRGTKENSGKIFSFANRLNQLGMGVVAFDFLGSGQSDGDFNDVTLSRQADDLSCVIDYVYLEYNIPVILLGRSFGGSTVLAGGTRDERVAGYILWSTPVKMYETFAKMLGEDFNRLISGKTINLTDEAGTFEIKPGIIKDFDQHNMNEYLFAIGKRPVLVVHGLEDEVVDWSNAKEINEYTQDSKLYLIEHADHRFTNKIIEREDLTIQWLKNTFYQNEGVG